MQKRHVTREIAFAEIKEEQRIAIEEIGALRHMVSVGIFREQVEGKSLRTKRVYAFESFTCEVLPI